MFPASCIHPFLQTNPLLQEHVRLKVMRNSSFKKYWKFGSSRLDKRLNTSSWKLVFMFLVVGFLPDSPGVRASDKTFIRSSSSQLWWIITKPWKPSPSPYNPAENRRISGQIRFLPPYPLNVEAKYRNLRKSRESYYGQDGTRFKLPLAFLNPNKKPINFRTASSQSGTKLENSSAGLKNE